jgi:flagellar biosynthesis/type III secretory pathway protein FliH
VVMELPLVPRITDPAEAERLPELGVLSTMANPDLEVATAALHAVSALPEDQKRLYLDVILAALPPSLRAALEHYMEGYVYQSDFARRYYSQGLEEGREQGLEEGNARGLRKAVLELMHAKLDVVTAEEQAAIDAIGDERALTELIGALARTAGATEARAVLAATRGTR